MAVIPQGERKRELGKPRCGQKDDTKINLIKIFLKLCPVMGFCETLVNFRVPWPKGFCWPDEQVLIFQETFCTVHRSFFYIFVLSYWLTRYRLI